MTIFLGFGPALAAFFLLLPAGLADLSVCRSLNGHM
jgi:hypothetical protein